MSNKESHPASNASEQTAADRTIVDQIVSLSLAHANPSTPPYGFPFEINSLAEAVAHVARLERVAASDSDIAAACEAIVPGHEGLKLYRQHTSLWRVCRNCMTARGNHSWCVPISEMVCVEPNEAQRRNRALAMDQQSA
jgi:hypothetical protein